MAVSQLFDRAAPEYDRARRQLVPCFDELYGAAVEAIPHPRDAPLRILDLGAGTGILSACVAQAFPGASFDLMDAAPAMLERARERFADAPSRFRFCVGDFSLSPWPGGPGDFDAVVSAIAIHHVDDAAKREVLRRARTALRGGGVFVNADQVLGDTPETERYYREQWLRQVRALGARESDVAAALERMQEDQSATLDAQLAWLSETGFAQVSCCYQNESFVVYSGRKPEPGRWPS